MKIAEALVRRTAITSELNALKDRMAQNVKVQEGDKPQENFEELMKLYKELTDELTDLVCRVNKTNQLITNEEGIPLADLLIQRDSYKTLTRTNKSLYDDAILVPRYARNEIRLVSAVDAAKIQEDISKYSKMYRDIDIQIQRINWTADLV